MPVRVDFRITALLLAALLAGAAQATTQYDYIQRVDRDGDGAISLPEYLDWMSRAFHDMDSNGDDVLAPEEQLVPTTKHVTLAAFHLRLTAQFRKQDIDGDGKLSAKEYLAPPR